MTLTANETAVILAIAFNYFSNEPGAEVWVDCINESSKPSGVTGKALSGVIASLVKKGLVWTSGDTLRLTKEGIALIPATTAA